MTMHLLRKVSASNSETFGKYEIRKLRGTFPIVILVEQAEASNILEPTKLTIRFCTRSSRPWSTTPDIGTVLHTWLNGRCVQIKDGFRSKEMLAPSLKQPWQWTVYMASVHR